MHARRVAGLALTTAALIAGSFALGRATGDNVTWHQGTATLGGTESSPQFTVTPGGPDWTYGARESVLRWVDSRGDSHDGGWPDCLLPPSESHPARPQVVPIKFGTVPVDDAEYGSGPRVVAVDCRT